MGDAVAGSDLLELTAQLIDIPSVSRSEKALADLVEARMAALSDLAVERIGDTVVARSDFGRDQRVLLGGHLDTVPPFGDVGASVEGDRVRGLGAVDMKGGVAVMLDVAGHLRAGNVDATLVFYACEEIERDANALSALARTRPELLAADAAVLAEPTGGVVEAGCQGTMRAVLMMGGRRAHSARPWTGVNAVHRLGAVLRLLDDYDPRTVVIDGCEYREALQAVRVEGGVANNVVPDAATLTLNYRFAPDRTQSRAEKTLRSLFAPVTDEGHGDQLHVAESAPGAMPNLGHELLARLVQSSGSSPRAKLGWTDVATMSALGIPAANFGPGDPLLAHTADECVTRAELEHVRDVLSRLVGVTAS